MGTDLGDLQERITSTPEGSIASDAGGLCPADSYTDPAPAATFAHLDATITLERALFEQAFFPAVDPLGSTSRLLTPWTVGEALTLPPFTLASTATVPRYRDIIAILGIEDLSEER